MKTIPRWASCLLLSLYAIILVGLGVVFRYKIIYDFSNMQLHIADVSGISVMTYNIKSNEKTDLGKTGWYYRAKYVAKNIQGNQASIICLQEVKAEQYEFFKKYLNGYDNVAMFRDNTYLAESNPIFYRKDLFEKVSSTSFWLSDTPEVQSNTWGGNCFRVCSNVVLKEKATGKQFAVFNTHLDHKSATARINGLNLIKSKIEALNLPTIITGDMNSTPYSGAITSFKKAFDDLANICDNDDATFNGYGKYNIKLDYIFKTKADFKVLDYRIIDKTYKGIFPSDHYPIFAKLEW